MMAKITIHSALGYVVASPMECVDLTKSIPEDSVLTAQDQVVQGAPAVSEETEDPSAETSD